MPINYQQYKLSYHLAYRQNQMSRLNQLDCQSPPTFSNHELYLTLRDAQKKFILPKLQQANNLMNRLQMVYDSHVNQMSLLIQHNKRLKNGLQQSTVSPLGELGQRLPSSTGDQYIAAIERNTQRVNRLQKRVKLLELMLKP